MQNLGDNVHYRVGIVEDTNDPLGLLRARVRLIGVYDEKVMVSHLPWATCMTPIGMTLSAPPKKGSFVVCWVVDEGMQQLIILGTIPGINNGVEPDTPREAINTPSLPPKTVEVKAANAVKGSGFKAIVSSPSSLLGAVTNSVSMVTTAINAASNPLDYIKDNLPNIDELSSVFDSTVLNSIKTSLPKTLKLSTSQISDIINGNTDNYTPEQIESVMNALKSDSITQKISENYCSIISRTSDIKSMAMKHFSDVLGKNEPNPLTDKTYGAKYPKNGVFQTQAGHTLEFDDTLGKERIHIYHKTGSYIEIIEDGSVIVKSVTNSYQISQGDNNEITKGTKNIDANNVKITVPGTLTLLAGNAFIHANHGLISGLRCQCTGAPFHIFDSGG